MLYPDLCRIFRAGFGYTIRFWIHGLFDEFLNISMFFIIFFTFLAILFRGTVKPESEVLREPVEHKPNWRSARIGGPPNQIRHWDRNSMLGIKWPNAGVESTYRADILHIHHICLDFWVFFIVPGRFERS